MWHSPGVEEGVQDLTPPCLTRGLNLGSEEKLSLLPPWASMTPAPEESPTCTLEG